MGPPRTLVAAVLSLLLVATACATARTVSDSHQPQVLVVMPLDVSTAHLDASAKATLEETLRSEAGRVLAPLGFTILTADTTLEYLKDNGIDATRVCDSNCALAAARELKAKFYVTGQVTRVEGALVAFLRLGEPEAGRQLNSIELDAGTVLDLRQLAEHRTRELLSPLSAPVADAAPAAHVDEESGERVAELPQYVIHFDSTPPGAVVHVDDEIQCPATPCSRALAQGLHHITMEREHYFAASRTATVVGEDTVSLTLDPQFGTLSIRTLPQGLATLVQREGTPSAGPAETIPRAANGDYELDPGVYQISINDPCYQTGPSTVVVSRGKHQDEQLVAQARTAGLTVKAEDSDGNALSGAVSVDGIEHGPTYTAFQVPLCSSTLEVRLADGRAARLPLNLSESKETTVTAVIPSRLMVSPLVADGEAPHGSTALHLGTGISLLAVAAGSAGMAIYGYSSAASAHSQLMAQSVPVDETARQQLAAQGNLGNILGVIGVIAGVVTATGGIIALATGDYR